MPSSRSPKGLAALVLLLSSTCLANPWSLPTKEYQDDMHNLISRAEASPEDRKRDAVPAGYVAAPYYPTPPGGWVAEWEDSYAKAQLVVGNMTLAEKVNLTSGTGYLMVRGSNQSQFPDCRDQTTCQHNLKEYCKNIGTMRGKHRLSSPLRDSKYLLGRLSSRCCSYRQYHSLPSRYNNGCHFQQRPDVCTWSGLRSGSTG